MEGERTVVENSAPVNSQQVDRVCLSETAVSALAATDNTASPSNSSTSASCPFNAVGTRMSSSEALHLPALRRVSLAEYSSKAEGNRLPWAAFEPDGREDRIVESFSEERKENRHDCAYTYKIRKDGPAMMRDADCHRPLPCLCQSAGDVAVVVDVFGATSSKGAAPGAPFTTRRPLISPHSQFEVDRKRLNETDTLDDLVTRAVGSHRRWMQWAAVLHAALAWMGILCCVRAVWILRGGQFGGRCWWGTKNGGPKEDENSGIPRLPAGLQFFRLACALVANPSEGCGSRFERNVGAQLSDLFVPEVTEDFEHEQHGSQQEKSGVGGRRGVRGAASSGETSLTLGSAAFLKKRKKRLLFSSLSNSRFFPSIVGNKKVEPSSDEERGEKDERSSLLLGRHIYAGDEELPEIWSDDASNSFFGTRFSATFSTGRMLRFSWRLILFTKGLWWLCDQLAYAAGHSILVFLRATFFASACLVGVLSHLFLARLLVQNLAHLIVLLHTLRGQRPDLYQSYKRFFRLRFLAVSFVLFCMAVPWLLRGQVFYGLTFFVRTVATVYGVLVLDGVRRDGNKGLIRKFDHFPPNR